MAVEGRREKAKGKHEHTPTHIPCITISFMPLVKGAMEFSYSALAVSGILSKSVRKQPIPTDIEHISKPDLLQSR